MSIWVGLAIAGFLLFLGLLGLLGGLLVVFQQLRRRSVVRAAKAKRAARAAELPVVPTEVYSASSRPTVPMMKAPPPRPVQGPSPVGEALSSPTLLPDVDDLDEDVPTGVFKPSHYQDIDAMLKEADKYVSNHRRSQ